MYFYKWDLQGTNAYVSEYIGEITESSSLFATSTLSKKKFDGSIESITLTNYEVKNLPRSIDDATKQVWAYNTEQFGHTLKAKYILKSEIFQKYVEDNPHSIL